MSIIDWKLYVIQQYTEKKRGTSDIGKELNKNPKLIRDVLVRANIPIRNHSAAQKLVIERNGPPREGPLSEEVKTKISIGLQNFWEALSPEETVARKESVSKVIKKHWDEMGDNKKSSHLDLMKANSRARVLKGSRAENNLADLISAQNIKVERRNQSIISPYELDIWLPDFRIGIEIDGPTHFLDIYGEENLKRVKARDILKDEACKQLNITLIRCQDKCHRFSRAACRRTLSKILEVIEKKQTGLILIDIR